MTNVNRERIDAVRFYMLWTVAVQSFHCRRERIPVTKDLHLFESAVWVVKRRHVRSWNKCCELWWKLGCSKVSTYVVKKVEYSLKKSGCSRVGIGWQLRRCRKDVTFLIGFPKRSWSCWVQWSTCLHCCSHIRKWLISLDLLQEFVYGSFSQSLSWRINELSHWRGQTNLTTEVGLQ